MKFAPIHIYSGYSFLKSGLTIDKIINCVKKHNYFGAAITDMGNMHGIPSFIKEMEKINKPFIVGLEINYLGNLFCLYAKDENGYRNLSKISSSIQKEESIDLKNLNKGVIAVLDTYEGEFKSKFNEQIDINLTKYLYDISSLFEEFYLGVEVKCKEDVKYANKLREFANKYNYSLVAFPKIKYQEKKDAIVLEIVEAIKNDEKLKIKEKTGEEYFFKEEDYQKIYRKEEMENTIKIVSSSTFNYHQKRGELLHYPVIDNEQYIKDLAFSRLKEIGKDSDNTYIDRLNYELSVIIDMGYIDYFLIVQDYVKYAKSVDILVGPGRGSAAGSLLSYLLQITDIDPIKHGLQFERFLNPSRKTMPDIDMDFMDTRRDDVFNYIKEKYGNNKVGHIVTFQTILAKQSLRDIGRIYDYPTHHIDLLSKRLTNHAYSLRESYKNLPAFKELVDSDKYFLEIVSLASKIEQLPRQTSLHAAGIVLNNSPIEEVMPISQDFNDTYISQYEMGYLEEQGFLKMDLLGLKNLTIIYNAVNLINSRYKQLHLDKEKIPYDDEKAINIIKQGKTMGIFQLESSGMKRAIKVLKPSRFDDVVALVALFRPGPMNFIPNYAKRKEGKEQIDCYDKRLEEILLPTYGILTYQEQISSLAMVMSNFSPSEADNFRRAVSKKNKEIMEMMKSKFFLGARQNNYPEHIITRVFDDISKFANYGFNKSHAVGYALIATRMAYLKAHYPLEFYASILENSSSTSDTKFNEYIEEMKSQNISMLPPDINRSTNNFSVREDGLLFPLNAIRGVNDLLTNNILLERKEGEFKSFFDFVKRMYKYNISETQINKLIDGGCFDNLYKSRYTLISTTKRALQYAENSYDSNGQLSLFSLPEPQYVIENDDPLENLDKEYQVLGVMLSNNPLKYKKDLLLANNVSPIIDVVSSTKKVNKIAGIVRTKKVINTKKGVPMAFVKLFDETGEIEITIFPNIYQNAIGITDKNSIILVDTLKEINKGETTYIANKIKLLESEE